jgi:methyltransferase (TIGR00027 family)
MEKNEVSRTALMTAYFRGYHALHVSPKIFNDFLANQILKEDELEFWDRYLLRGLEAFDPKLAATFPDQMSAITWSMQVIAGPPLTLSRARYTEDLLKKAITEGVRQYVILGAGMDTFAFRCPELVKQLQVFEVDHPVTQEFKRHRLAELAWEVPAQLHFIPVDLTQTSLVEALKHSSYDPLALSFFSWLGVTYYLPYETVFATLRLIAEIAPSGSTVVFDYLDTDAFTPQKAAPRTSGMIAAAHQIGEPMKAGFEPSKLSKEFTNFGLRLQESLSPTDIEERYFGKRTDNYHALEHAHFACAMVE